MRGKIIHAPLSPGVMYPKLIWKMKKVQSAKFVRKKRIYLKAGAAIHPFLWIEFLDDGSFSLGFMSKQVKLTEYGSAIQRGAEFTQHAQVVRRGNIPIDETETPHYTFHPPRISQRSGIVHMVDATGKIDEWEFDWFPVRKVDHILTVYSGQLTLLGTVVRPRKNFSIIAVPPSAQGLRMDMFICPVRTHIGLDSLAIDNVIGGCKHYNLVCSFYKDSSTRFSIYVATEMRGT
jgi:hypothetical protein